VRPVVAVSDVPGQAASDPDDPLPPLLLARRAAELIGEYGQLATRRSKMPQVNRYPHVPPDVVALLRAATWLEAAVFAATDGERGPGPTLPERLAAAERALAARATPEAYGHDLAVAIERLVADGIDRISARQRVLDARLGTDRSA
jgi:hypothetical protein